jgi:hypothetical protein
MSSEVMQETSLREQQKHKAFVEKTRGKQPVAARSLLDAADEDPTGEARAFRTIVGTTTDAKGRKRREVLTVPTNANAAGYPEDLTVTQMGRLATRNLVAATPAEPPEPWMVPSPTDASDPRHYPVDLLEAFSRGTTTPEEAQANLVKFCEERAEQTGTPFEDVMKFTVGVMQEQQSRRAMFSEVARLIPEWGRDRSLMAREFKAMCVWLKRTQGLTDAQLHEFDRRGDAKIVWNYYELWKRALAAEVGEHHKKARSIESAGQLFAHTQFAGEPESVEFRRVAVPDELRAAARAKNVDDTVEAAGNFFAALEGRGEPENAEDRGGAL